MDKSQNKTKKETRAETESQKLEELYDLLNRANSLSTGEYIEHLKRLRHQSTVLLEINLTQRKMGGTGALVNVLDKVHTLLNSVEGTVQSQTGNTVNIKYDLPLPGCETVVT